MRILIVEDEQTLAESIARGLRREGMAVDIATDGQIALEKIDINPYEVVVLDRDLPIIHGDSVCQQVIRQQIPTRILMLTAATTIDDRVDGLQLGADDYLTKPFAFRELVARIRALGRRTISSMPAQLTWQDLSLDPARRQVSRGGQLILLATKEFALLERLLRAEGAIVSAEALLEQVWDEHADPFTNTVRATMYNLRRKLGNPALIETVIGAGYRMITNR
jgi:DNA-binding response OmpR family regulator